ncbi:MAG: DUF507 family protein [Bacteriovoracia bacterium]
MQTTNNHSLKTLAKSILTKLENQQIITNDPKKRTELYDEFQKELSRWMLTDEDLTQMVRSQVTENSDKLSEQNLSETEAFQSQKRALRQKFEENAVQGFYLKTSLRDVCKGINKFLLSNPLIEDVFETDEVIERFLLETIQKFDESKMS